MADLKKKLIKTATGFTLVELLVVIGIASMVMATALFLDVNSYRGYSFRSEQDVLGTTLQTARAEALNNIDQEKHGVAIHPGGYDGYIIFSGDTYATADHAKDEKIKASYNVNFSASPGEIVFDQLSGDANYDGDITLVDLQRNLTSIISINHEGKISW